MTWYSKSLQCSCQKASIQYKNFIAITTTFHQICSSEFAGTAWRDYLFLDEYWHNYARADIRSRGSLYFVFLSTLCQLSQTTVKNALDQFLNKTFINTQILSRSEFRLQIDSLFLQFQTQTTSKFSRSLNLLRDIMNDNALVSSCNLNWNWQRDSKRIYTTIPTQPVIMEDGCSCATRNDCSESGGIYFDTTNAQIFPMYGWNVGCSVVETVLRSTFECLYDQSCLDFLLFYATIVPNQYPYKMNISAMNFSRTSRFRRDAFIQTIIDELFIEEWKINKYYSSFYNACAPISCSYIIRKEDYYMYTVSRILGLYGGLTIVLRLIVSVMIKLSFEIVHRCRRNRIVSSE
ncbi:hypothetical protein I4U23_023299 [Adineta vaga]|nr:hypothetical protein I4U23_023299 [Adineta vaga]